MVETILGVAALVAVLVLLYGLVCLVRPLWLVHSRKQAGGVVIAALVVCGVLGSVPPSRPSNIPPPAWAERVEVCRRAMAVRDCPKSDADVAAARAAVAKAAHDAEQGQVQSATAAATTASAAAGDGAGLKYEDRDGVARPVMDSALNPYDPKDDADIYRAWGTAGVRRIERLRHAAADAVAKSGKCDQVNLTELADQRSKPPKHPVVMVACVNQAQFFVSEEDVERGIQSEDDRAAAVRSVTFTTACDEQVQAMLTYPSSFNLHWGQETTKDDAGNYGLVIHFDALNGFGNKVPKSAVCMSTPTGGMKVRIVNR